MGRGLAKRIWAPILRGGLVLAAAWLVLGAAGPALAQASPGTDVKHLALIIGNADYDRDGVLSGPTVTPPRGMLRDLKNACNDAQLFKRRLIEMRWREDEITFPKCNLTTPEMRELITAFREKVANAKNTLAILYYAGHGAQFSSGDTAHSYLFGVGAKIDLDQVAQSLRTSPDNTSFVATQAFDIHEFSSTLGRQTENAVLIIFDACRENPLYAQISDLEQSPSIQALSASPDQYTGIVVAYATSAGNFAKDGFGQNSIYTKALTDLFLPTRNFDSVLDRVRTAVAAAYAKNYPNQHSIQEPDTRGRFTGDWCVYACPPDAEPLPLAAASGGPTLAFASRGAVLQRLAGPADVIVVAQANATPRVAAPAASAAVMKPVQRLDPPKVVFDRAQSTAGASAGASASATAAPAAQAALPEPAMRFDVFWCDGGAEAADRERRANEIAAALGVEAQRRQNNQAFTAVGRAEQHLNQSIGSVRVRELSPEANAAFGYRYASDVAIYDAGDEAEVQWSRFAAKIGGFSIAPKAETNKTPGYMSIFVCRGARTSGPTAIFLQAPTPAMQKAGNAILQQLAERLPQVFTTRPTELRTDGPQSTEIRFYHAEDRDNVFKTAAAIEQVLGHPVKVKFLQQYANLAPAGRMEVWLGVTEAPVSLGSIPQRAGGPATQLKVK